MMKDVGGCYGARALKWTSAKAPKCHIQQPTLNFQRVRMKGEIFANGKRCEVELPCTVEEFLAGRGLKPTQVVVELNGEALERGRFGEIDLKEGDRLEVVLPVAGG